MFKLASVAVSLALALGAAAQLTINTPASVVQCQPVQLAFVNGLPPYFLSIIPGGQVSAAALENLGTTSANTLTWNADIAAGTSITFEIRDSEGVTAFSAPVTVQVSSDATCVGKNSLTNTNTATAPAGTGSTIAPPATKPTTTTPAPGNTSPQPIPGITSSPKASTTAPSSSTTAKASGAASLSKSSVLVALGVAAGALALLA